MKKHLAGHVALSFAPGRPSSSLKGFLVVGGILVSACGHGPAASTPPLAVRALESRAASRSLEQPARPQDNDRVAVRRTASGRYLATLAGASAASLRQGLTKARYESPHGGLKIQCADNDGPCTLAVETPSADLSTVHRPEDGGNTDLLQVWLSGKLGEEFYLHGTKSKERFISDDLGLKTYEKQVVDTKDEDAALRVSCYRRVTPQLIVFHSTRYDCVFSVSGFAKR